METEQDRLQKLYGEMSDEHLLDLEDDQEDLTDEARLVLTHELRKRGMLREPSAPNDEPMPATFEPERESGFTPGIPGMYPSSAAAMEQALEPAQAAKDGMSNLISFYDGMELSKACTILEEAELDPVIEPIEGDAMYGVPPRFEVWLETGQIDHAKTLLRAKMGLFPMQEVDGEGYASEGATGLVGVFPTSEEADEVKELLSEVGIAATIAQDDETGDWQVTVDPAEQDRAVAAVASGMGLG
jgi:hypothetical protein